MRNRTVTLLAILLAVLSSAEVCAREQTIVLGDESGWGAQARTDRLVQVPGRLGSTNLELMPYRNDADSETELLLHFDTEPLTDEAGNFVVAAETPEISTTTRRSGTGSLLVDEPADVVRITPEGSVLFRPGVEWGSFTLEFWLYPVTLSEGDTVIEWTGREDGRLNFREQRLWVGLHNRRLEVSFENFFVPPDQSALTVTLEGDNGLIPRQWAHHVIRFSDETGLLEYLVHGRTVDVTHVSGSGSEDGTVFFPRVAVFPDEAIQIVPAFTGAIDELRLLRRFETQTETPLFHPSGGVYESEVLDLGSPGARVTGISADATTPAMTDVFLYYRLANTRNGVTGVDAEWVPVTRLEDNNLTTGRFVQLRAELLPDPQTPQSPVLSEIHLSYVPDPPPLPPAGLRATPGNGQVELSWAPVLEEDIQGYLVYYGLQPGRYFGRGADLGPSPVDVGEATSVIVSGLENGTLYYFAVSAYDTAGAPGTRELSNEVAARPARVYR